MTREVLPFGSVQSWSVRDQSLQLIISSSAHQLPNPFSLFFFGFRFFLLPPPCWKADSSNVVPGGPALGRGTPSASVLLGPYPAFFRSSSSCRWSKKEVIPKYATPNVSTDRATTARVNKTEMTGSSGAGREAGTAACAVVSSKAATRTVPFPFRARADCTSGTTRSRAPPRGRLGWKDECPSARPAARTAHVTTWTPISTLIQTYAMVITRPMALSLPESTEGRKEGRSHHTRPSSASRLTRMPAPTTTDATSDAVPVSQHIQNSYSGQFTS